MRSHLCGSIQPESATEKRHSAPTAPSVQCSPRLVRLQTRQRGTHIEGGCVSSIRYCLYSPQHANSHTPISNTLNGTTSSSPCLPSRGTQFQSPDVSTVYGYRLSPRDRGMESDSTQAELPSLRRCIRQGNLASLPVQVISLRGQTSTMIPCPFSPRKRHRRMSQESQASFHKTRLHGVLSISASEQGGFSFLIQCW